MSDCWRARAIAQPAMLPSRSPTTRPQISAMTVTPSMGEILPGRDDKTSEAAPRGTASDMAIPSGLVVT